MAKGNGQPGVTATGSQGQGEKGIDGITGRDGINGKDGQPSDSMTST
jgi:hypothetical protein